MKVPQPQLWMAKILSFSWLCKGRGKFGNGRLEESGVAFVTRSEISTNILDLMESLQLTFFLFFLLHSTMLQAPQSSLTLLTMPILSCLRAF